jgi:hypothetical protein
MSAGFANGGTANQVKGPIRFEHASPGPRSEVLAPARDPSEAKTDYVALFGAIAQILASTIAIIVVLRR